MGSEFLRIKGILDKIHETEDETKMIAEVSRIKAMLDSSGYKSEGVLCDMLWKLKQTVVSMKVLEVTMIGKSVSSLMNHVSKVVRQTARMLVRSWRRMVDEWIVDNDTNAAVQEEECGKANKNISTEKPLMVPRKFNNNTTEKPRNPKGADQSKEMVIGANKLEVRKEKPKDSKLQHKKRLTMVVLEKESKKNRLAVVERHKPSVETMKLQKPTRSIVPLKTLDKRSVEEKLEATKRKLQENYKEAENNKRQRRIQVIEVHDVLSMGLAPKYQDSRFGKYISHRRGLVC